jgi:hypothetical protein
VGLLFAGYQLCNRKTKKNHIVAFILGSLLFWILRTPILKLKGARGMLVVGVLALILLLIWRRRVLLEDDV